LTSLICALFFVSISDVWAQVSILNDQNYIGEDGTFHIVGEIQNDIKVPLNQVVVTATFYTKDNQILGTAKASSVLETIMPNNKAPFDLLFTEKKSSLIDSYSLELQYKPTDFKTQVLEVTSSSSKIDILNNFIVSGIITNHGDATANILTVIATFYDRDGNVVAVEKTYPEPSYLGSGEETPFVISIPEKTQSKKTIDYAITVESEEHAVVPEFPLGSGILLMVSVSAYVLITRMPGFLTKNLSLIINANSAKN